MDPVMSVAGAFRVIVSELSAVGLEPAAICRGAGMDPRILEDHAAPLDANALAAILARAEATAGDGLLGLHMAERAQGRGVLSYLTRSQRTVGAGLEAFVRFAAARWANPAVVGVARRGARAVVHFHLGPPLPRHAIEYVVTRTAVALRRSGAPPSEVTFAHAPGGPAREYERVLRCPVRFRHGETGVSVRVADLGRPLRAANADAASALAAALLRPPAAQPTTASARLAVAVETALARGAGVDRERLARSLGMSGRTLARRLAGEERRFRDVVDEVRRTQARRLLLENALDLGEIATRVGFADLAAFGKAFRRWFGVSPSAFRAGRTG